MTQSGVPEKSDYKPHKAATSESKAVNPLNSSPLGRFG